MRTADVAYDVEFGGTESAPGSYSQEVSEDTSVRLSIDSIKRAMMITIGTKCRLHGPLAGMQNVRAAFDFGVDELGGLLNSVPTSSHVPTCQDCESEHFASEPCAEAGTVTQHDKAYRIAHKYQMLLPPRMTYLLVDSAALWVERGDRASIIAARNLLRLFASSDDAADILYALTEVYHRDGVWILDSVQSELASQHAVPPSADTVADVAVELPALPPGTAETT